MLVEALIANNQKTQRTLLAKIYTTLHGFHCHAFQLANKLPCKLYISINSVLLLSLETLNYEFVFIILSFLSMTIDI